MKKEWANKCQSLLGENWRVVVTADDRTGCVREIYSQLCSITPVATKVHVMLWSFVVLTWMRDAIELV